MDLKIGSRLRSTVCDTEVVVVRGGGAAVDLRCGGHPMIGTDNPAPPGRAMDAGFAGGAVLGKRYVDPEGRFELLCSRAGDGSLSVGAEPLALKEAKPLPASD